MRNDLDTLTTWKACQADAAELAATVTATRYGSYPAELTLTMPNETAERLLSAVLIATPSMDEFPWSASVMRELAAILAGRS